MINKQFIEADIKSPVKNGGMFKIYISTDNKRLFKKINEPIDNIFHYKEKIHKSINDYIIGKFIHKPENIHIEEDGSYYCEYIKNGIRLYDIDSNSIIDNTILNNLKRSVQDIKNKLNDYAKTNKLSGDWALHNLIYCLDTNKIYNVDLEGFYTYPFVYDNGNCDIKYCNERFDKLLDIIENKLENKRFDTCFVTFSTDNNYLKLSEVMIKSLSLFSKYPIILYCVNFDTAFFNKKYSNVFCKRIDLNEKDNIFLLKPAIIYDSIVNLGVKNGIYIESDDIAVPYIDNLFNECSRIDKYPLCPIHPKDPNNQTNIMKILNVTKKSMPYVHGHVVFTDTTVTFIKEWYDVCKKYIKSASNFDETILNVLLWKYNVTDYINYIYDPYYNRIFDNKFKEKYGDLFDESKVYMYHGSKNATMANDILNKIIAKYDYKYFTLILWNPTLFQSEIILEDIPNIIEKKEIVIPKESLHNYIFDIYKLDTRCSHNIVLPPKIQKLKEYDNKHLIVKFKIDEPQYTNNICNQAVQLKEMIRRKYKSYIKNYIKDIIIHVADNFEQSKYIWEKNIKTREDSYNHILDIIRYVKDSGTDYSAKHIDIGYHSIKIDGIYHKGQRDCIKRLEFCKEEYDFTNKNILDVGCCIGGMLFPLSSEINYGCGIDFNYRNINAGNAIKQYTKTDNLSFYIFDLDKEELQFIKNFIPQIDVVFLYSVCMWIKKWKGLIDFISLNSKVLFIETNGSQFQQLEQINYCKLKFKIIKQIYDKSLDDKGQHNRKLYICKN